MSINRWSGLALIVTACLRSTASEPTPEQLSLMRQYGLTIPPIILDRTGRDITKHLPEASAGQIEVILVQPEPVELPIKKKVEIKTEEVKAEIVAPEILLLNDGNFSKTVEQSKGMLLVEFYARWCQPCRNMAPALEQLSQEGIAIAKIDIDESPVVTRSYGVNTLPTLVKFENGIKSGVGRIGVASKETIRAWLGVVERAVLSQATPQPHGAQTVQADYQPEYREYSPQSEQSRRCGHSWGRP